MPDSIKNQLGSAASLLEKTSDSARLDAEILLANVLDWPRSRLYARADERLSDAAKQRYLNMLSARIKGEPVAYVVGTQEFWSLEFEVSPDCLVPRPETELLVEWALRHDPAAELDVLDLGTGSGAIAIAIARERPAWRVTAVEKSPDALALAVRNAARHQVQVDVQLGDWFESLEGRRYALIISNPPYVAENDEHLEALKYEPINALVAGPDGLDDLRHIIEIAPNHLVPDGWLALEHGKDQGADVRDLFSARGYTDISTLNDLAGLERVSAGRWPAV